LLAGRYRLAQRLGSGAPGSVLAAHDVVLGRDVAIKLLAGSDVRPADANRFRWEASAVARLLHPGIIAVFDFGYAAGQPFMVMELLRGRDLRELLGQDRGGLPVSQVLSVGIQVADAQAAQPQASQVRPPARVAARGRRGG
jgi:serine/threonine protein kinase